MKRLLVLGLCLGLMSVASAQNNTQEDPAWPLPAPPQGATQFDFKLKGYVLGLRMIKAQYTGHYNDDLYAARANLKTSGLGALLKKLRIWAITTGTLTENVSDTQRLSQITPQASPQISAQTSSQISSQTSSEAQSEALAQKPDANRDPVSTLRPMRHVQQNLDKKSRRVEMDYDTGTQTVSVDINPPLGSQGIPPASEDERYKAYDTITAIMAMMLQPRDTEGPLCAGRVPVFDSKQHYNLRMVRAGTKSLKYENDKYKSVKCKVYYEPVSGFDPEDLPDADEKNTPVMVYFTAQPIHGLHVPMRFTYKVSGIKVVIKVTDLKISPPPL